MPKLNVGHDYSLFGFLRKNIAPLNRFCKRFIDDETQLRQHLSVYDYYDMHDMNSMRDHYDHHYEYEDRTHSKLLIPPFQSFIDIGKDVVDTVRPYKGFYQSTRDFLQPFYGIGNILKGVLNLVAAPFALIIGIFEPLRLFAPFIFRVAPLQVLSSVWHKEKINFSQALSWTMHGAFSLLRGVGQVATFPLTWFIKMPFRGLITLIKGVPKIEDNDTIQHLVAKGRQELSEIPNRKLDHQQETYLDNFSSFDRIANQLHAKYLEAVAQGRATSITPSVENNNYEMKHREEDTQSPSLYSDNDIYNNDLQKVSDVFIPKNRGKRTEYPDTYITRIGFSRKQIEAPRIEHASDYLDLFATESTVLK